MRKLITLISTNLIILILIAVPAAENFSFTYAIAAAPSNNLQNQIDAYNQQITTLSQQIAQYQEQLQKIGSDKATLQDAINALNIQVNSVQAHITLAQHEINSTQLQIVQSETAVESTGQLITANQAAIADEIRNLQQNDNQSIVVSFFSSGTFLQAWNDANQGKQVEKAIQGKVYALQDQENQLAQEQAVLQQHNDELVSQKQDLASQQRALIQTQKSKNSLLAQTNAQESKYQRLLAQAKAQLASFSAFVQNAGGAGILGDQTVCDDWGCYYNQRDSAWGNMPLNGTKYNLASDGCLVTAMAMVMTHYGYRNVTPVSVNANPANFASYYPAYLLMTVEVAGVSATRVSAAIDSTLGSGDPVVVGVRAYGGTHFVVLVSGSHGNYLMRDPYISNGKDISFSAHYGVRNIYEISRIVIQ